MTGERRWEGATWHDSFARCPECSHATVGLRQPYAINHAVGCSMPPIPNVDDLPATAEWLDGYAKGRADEADALAPSPGEGLYSQAERQAALDWLDCLRAVGHPPDSVHAACLLDAFEVLAKWQFRQGFSTGGE